MPFLFQGNFQLRRALIVIFCTCFLPAHSSLADSVAELSAKLRQIDAQIEALPHAPPTAAPWTIGTGFLRNGETEPIIIEIEFSQPARVDLVVLMPLTYSDATSGILPHGFPKRFLIERLLPDGRYEVIADHRNADYPIFGIEPQLFHCPHSPDTVETSGLRITATRLADNHVWKSTAPYFMGLSEVYAFAGAQNVALNGAVSTKGAMRFGYTFNPVCLVDGFSLFSHVDWNLANARQGRITRQSAARFRIDLGRVGRVDELRLWPRPVNVQENFPQANGIHFPMQIRLEQLDTADVSEGAVLYQHARASMRPGSTPLSVRLTKPSEGQHFLLTIEDPLLDFRIWDRNELALSEVELVGSGQVLTRNLPLEIEVSGSAKADWQPQGVRNVFTDGISGEGQILPLRQWLEQFSRRSILARKRDTLSTQLDMARIREEQRSRFLIVIGAGLILILLLLIRVLSLRAKQRQADLRERLAADLHDEVGANLTSIAHSTQLFEENLSGLNPFQTRLLKRIEHVAHQTAQDTRHFVKLLRAPDQSASLTEQIRHFAQELFEGIECELDLQTRGVFEHWPAQRKWDLFLFFKEALNNIAKHSGANKVSLYSKRTAKNIEIRIEDNGCGIPAEKQPPRALHERAKRTGGHLQIDSSPGGGTQIRLTIGHK